VTARSYLRAMAIAAALIGAGFAAVAVRLPTLALLCSLVAMGITMTALVWLLRKEERR